MDINLEIDQVSTERKQTHSRRLPRSATKILKRWFTANNHNPRPSDTDKRELQEQTGLSVHQISNWFANTRRRGFHRPASDFAVYNTGRLASIYVPDISSLESCLDTDPLGRWRNSPPEDEPASFSAIANALSDSGGVLSGIRYRSRAEQSIIPNVASRPSSETSFGSVSTTWTTDSSLSTHSVQSLQSYNNSTSSATSAAKNNRRRGRQSLGRIQPSFRKSLYNRDEHRIFECTFCTDKFKTKHDWTRHERTLHLVLEKWTCAPNGPVYYPIGEQQHSRCIFCDQPDPPASHFALHNYDACIERLPAECSFRRKDHLRQHLRLIHNVQEPPQIIDTWKTKTTQIDSRCGFCSQRFTQWTERNEHIAEHFRKGARMKDWKGDRGFTYAVALLVENAMPPYLISTESNEFEPFSASRNWQCNYSTTVADRLVPTRFEDLTARLTERVNTAIRDGVLVTDEMVRGNARLIMFGDDDAWNQTPADNPEWLRLFKIGLGLGFGNPASIHVQLPDTDLVHRFSDQDVADLFSGTQISTSDSFDQLPNFHSTLPWTWQTPECLAELRHWRQKFDLVSTSHVAQEYSREPTSSPSLKDYLATLDPDDPRFTGLSPHFSDVATNPSISDDDPQ